MDFCKSQYNNGPLENGLLVQYIDGSWIINGKS